MPNYTETMTEIASWSCLKKALYDAADSYLKHPDVQKTKSSLLLLRWIPNLPHGDLGRFRAENLKRLVDYRNEITNDDIFIVLNAVFKSTSNLLKRCIAGQLFGGEYHKIFVYRGVEHVDNTLVTNVFSEEFFLSVKTRNYAFQRSSTEIAQVDHFDKISAVQGILDHLVKNYVNDPNFDLAVAQQLELLEKKPVEQETQMCKMAASV